MTGINIKGGIMPKYKQKYSKHVEEMMNSIFEFIKSYKKKYNDISPTITEIGNAVGLNITQTYGYINRLKAEGYVSTSTCRKPMIINIIDKHNIDKIEDDAVGVPEHIVRKVMDFIEKFEMIHDRKPTMDQIVSEITTVDRGQVILAAKACLEVSKEVDIKTNSDVPIMKPYGNIANYEIWTSDDRNFKENDIVQNDIGQLFIILSISIPYDIGDDMTVVIKKLPQNNPHPKYALAYKDFKERLSTTPNQKYAFEKVISIHQNK